MRTRTQQKSKNSVAYGGVTTQYETESYESFDADTKPSVIMPDMELIFIHYCIVM